MHVPHNAHVLVADGRKMLFFRNEGDADYPNLQVEDAEEHPNPRDVDQKTDLAGRSASTGAGTLTGGGSGSSMGETDYHQQEEDRFAAETAAMLNSRAEAGGFEKLIVVASPKTLGELRKHYGKALTGKIAGELAKDLTGHPFAEIEKALASA